MTEHQRYRIEKRTRGVIFLTILACFVHTGAFAQQDSIRSLLKRFNQYRSQTLEEKLYVRTDRTFYLTGETIWFNVYYLDASMHRPLDVSKVAYLEILDRDNKAVLQTKVGMREGGGNGTFFLPTSLPSGNYVLRAYTQWMRNFSPDFYFQQPVTITNPFVKAGLKPYPVKSRYDVQFFPEGGHLVNGLQSTVGFRVVDENGKGIEFEGAVLGEKNDTIIHFRPLKFGIGNFSITPTKQTYKASIRDRKGNATLVELPAVENEGFSVHVEENDQNQVLVNVNSRGQKQLTYLLVHTRQATVLADAHFLTEGKTQFAIEKNKLGDGISHLTLFNHEMRPVCERLYFKQPQHKLTLEAHTDQGIYSLRQKINLDLFAHEMDGRTEELELSVSVARMDSLQNGNASDIISYLWLTSELKGNIESPGTYFQDESKSGEALDNLMLTHGWSRFRWDDILSNKGVDAGFIPECNGQMIHGRVLDVFTGGPVKGIMTYLSTPGKNIRLYASRSDEQGKVQYEMQDFVGARRIVAQTNNLIDSTYRIEMVNSFSESFSVFRVFDIDLSESQRNAITGRSFQMQIQNAFYDENPNRIDIPKTDSAAFYGDPDEHYWLDDYTRFPTMEEVMREYVPGVLVRKRKGKFHFMTIDNPNKSVFRTDPMVLIDGVPVFDVDKIMEFDPRKIKKLDVITQQYFFGPLSFDGLVSYTTYNGDLSDFQPNAHALMTKYDGLQWKREFFVPRFEVQDSPKARIPDLRNLLYWTPNAKTSNQGRKHLEFYSSDVPGTYTVIIEGISNKGVPGMGTFTFIVTDRDKF